MTTDSTTKELVTPAEAVRVALGWHGEGRLAEAALLYERVLDVEPDHAEALHFLGLLKHQLGSSAEGLNYLRKAVAAAPGYAEAHSNLGNMLMERNELDEAETAYRRALALAPTLVDAKNNLAMLLRRRNDKKGAELLYREAIGQAPEEPVAYNNLGHLLADMGRHDEAITVLQRAVALNPEFSEAFRNLGHALAAQRRTEEAAVAYRRAVELGADAYLGLATALRDQGLVDEAIAAYRKVVDIGGRQATIFHSLGSLLSAQQCKTEAAEVFEQWLEWDPDNPVARHMLAANRQASESAPPERASDAYVEAIFDGFAPKFDKRLAGLEYRAPELIAGALRHRVGAPAASLCILDVGCGTGLCGPLLRPFAKKLVGVDLSSSMLALARERGGYDALFKEELTRYLVDTPEQFDVIIAADTLVYFGDLQPVLRATSRALAQGGSLIATLEKSPPDDESAYRLNGHGRYSHSESSFRAACTEHGLSVRVLDTVALRMEMARPVEGMLFCVSRDD